VAAAEVVLDSVAVVAQYYPLERAHPQQVMRVELRLGGGDQHTRMGIDLEAQGVVGGT